MRLTSQVIIGVLRIFQKFLNRFNCTAISVFMVCELLLLTERFHLNSKYLEFVILVLGSSLQNFHKFPLF